MTSLADSIEASVHRQQAETASNNVKRQELMMREGELIPVNLVGPNGAGIPAVYSPKEQAYYPVFK